MTADFDGRAAYESPTTIVQVRRERSLLFHSTPGHPVFVASTLWVGVSYSTASTTILVEALSSSRSEEGTVEFFGNRALAPGASGYCAQRGIRQDREMSFHYFGRDADKIASPLRHSWTS